MTEKIMDITAIPSYLAKKLQVTRVKIREVDHVITITPADTDPFYSAKNMAQLLADIADVKAGRAVLTEHELIEADDD
ncbi:MAG: hypothetical protein FWG63_05980 [Defluviitaleaceae bacterium]|nr:hypothetical protein [Defluviitaleaceae bacterium]